MQQEKEEVLNSDRQVRDQEKRDDADLIAEGMMCDPADVNSCDSCQ